MNRNLYRIVFNVKRGQLMAVAETASAQGKTTGETRGGTGGGLLSAMRPVCFAVLAALGMAAPLTQAQIVADPNAPGSQRSTILRAANGVALVNIPPPAPNGMSIAAFSDYNVSGSGVILNNSRTNIQTQLGGFATGNPNLARGSASSILVQVNSNNPTNLNGPTEIAGPRTPLIIANPSGILINGASFLNTSNLTLTTGTPVLNGGGDIDSYRVQGGMVNISGLGLDASTVGFTNILARAVTINASLYADQLQIITGANSVSAADPSSTTPITGTGPRPTFSLDAGLLSGMYANSIKFKSTEDGLEIVHKGTIGVTASALFQINGGVNNQGVIQAQGSTQIQANGNVSNSGQLSAGQTLMIDTPGALDNSAGSLSAARLDISATSLANRGGSIEQTGAQALSLQSRSVSNAAGGQIGQTPAAGTPASGGTGSASTVTLADGVLRIGGALNNDAGRINAAGAMDLSTSNGLNNDTGTLSLRQLHVAGGNVSNQGGTLRTQGDMRIEAGQVQNQGGSLTAEGRLQLSAAGINNQGGEIVQTGGQDTSITVTAPTGTLDNTQGRIASKGQNLALSAQTFINTDGKLEHAGAGTLDIAAGTLSGQRGQIKGNAAVNLSATAINQDAGSLTAAQLTINATTLSNRSGQISQAGTGQATITASQGIDNTDGTITSKGGAVLGTATLTNSQGSIAAEQNVAITATSRLDNTDGVIAAIQNLGLTGGAVNNTRGTIQAGADATLNAGDIQNTGGNVYAGANLSTNAANVSNSGSFYAAGNQTLSASGALTNSGVVASQGNTRITANSLQGTQGSVLGAGIKEDGTLAAGGKLDITTTQSLAANGQVLATGNAILSGGSVDLSGSQASAANITATATAGDISTRNATVSTAGTLSLTAKAGNARSLDNSGGTLSAGQLALDVANLNNQGGRIFQTGTGDTAILLASPAGTLNNSAGHIASNGQNLGLAAQTLINTDGKIEHAGAGTLAITATTLSGQRGQITGNGAVNVSASAINHESATLIARQLSINATTLSNRAGQISQTGTGQTTITASQSIDNTGGAIASNGNTTISTASLGNVQGRITSGQSATVTAGTQLDNTDGVLAAAQNLALAGGAVNNTRGALQAGGNAALTVGDIQNTGGSVYAGAHLGVDAGNVSNTGSIYAAGNQTLNATGAITSSGLIAAQGDTTVRANSLNSTAGSILGAGIKADGTLATGGKLDVTATQGLAANGQVLAAGNASLSGGSVDLSGSQVAAANIAATATSGDITTRSATVSTPGALSLTAKANNAQVLNNSSGNLNASQLKLDVANLNNHSGQVIQTGAGDTSIALASPTGALDNTSGRIAVNSQNLTLAAGTLTNTDGKIEHAGSGTLGLTATTVNGQRGQITSLGALALNAGAVNHDSAGTTARQITIAAASLNNHAGEIIQTGTDATGITVTAALDNSAGKIASKGNATVSAQSINNQGGLLQAAGTSSLNITTTAALDNSAGGQITSSGTLNNNAGLISAGNIATVQDTAASRSLAITNTAGTIIAGQNTNIKAASLGGDGKVLSRKDLKVDLTADFNNTGEVSAAANATVTTLGILTNSGTLQAGATLDVTAATISNAAAGKMVASTLKLTATDVHTLINRGLIDGANTQINTVTAATINNAAAGKMAASTLKLTATDVHTLINRGLIDGANTQINTVTLNNLGTGRIYGEIVGIAATTVNNDAENGVAATIAARQRLDIGAAIVNNRNGALIFSAGTGANALGIGGALDPSGHATGQAGLINNSASTIESLGGMTLSAANIQNTNPSFSYTLSNTAPVSKMDFVASDGTVYPSSAFAWTTTSRLSNAANATGLGLVYAGLSNFPVIAGQLPGSPYANPLYKVYYEGLNAFEPEITTPPSGDFNNGFYYPDVLNYQNTDPIWAVFGMAQPSNTKPGPRPVRTWMGTDDQGAYVDPTPEQTAAWEAASAPWQALQAKLDAFRATADSYQKVFSVYRSYTETDQTATVAAGTPGKILSSGAMTLNASNQLLNDNSQIIAGGALNVTGQAVSNQATQVTATLSRAGTIAAGQSQSALSISTFAEGSDGFGSRSTEERSSATANNALGSRIGGNTVTAVSGNDLTITAGRDINATAATIQAATNSSNSSSFKETKESGILDSGAGITIGTRQESTDQKTTSTTAAASTIGSVGGNVSLQAGNAYKQVGSDIKAPGGNIDITAKQVDIVEARETSQSQTEQKFSQSGLSVGLSSTVVSAAQEARGQISAMSQTSDDRSKALAAAVAVAKLAQAAQALEMGQFSGVDPATGKLFTPNAADKAGGVSLNISLSSSQSQSNSSTSADTARGSTVDAGGNVNIQATGAGQASNLTIQGSTAKAGNNLTLQADGDINLLAAKNTGTNTNTNSSSASSIGASIGLGSAGGVTYNASTNKSQGQGNGTDESYTNTQVQAGNTASLKSGADTTLKGAVVSANQIKADVGGNLAIESLQDKSTYQETNQSSGGSISLSASGIPTGASLSSGKSNIDNNLQSVTEQSGLKAGDGGFQVSVAGNTDLKGGAITSTQSAIDQGKNSFITGGSLTAGDIRNSASYSATGSGSTVGVGSELNKSGMGIHERKEIRKKPALNALYEPQYARDLGFHHLKLLSRRYSRGDPTSELPQYFDPLLNYWEESERLGKEIWTPEQQHMRHTWAVNLDYYIDCFWLVGLALSLSIPDDQWHRLLVLIGNEGEDILLDRIIATRQPGRKIGVSLCYPKPYARLLKAIDAQQNARAELLKVFVENWYAEVGKTAKSGREKQAVPYKEPYWHGYHKLEGGYFGYWCFEAIAAVKAFGLDDSLCIGHPHYPGDLLRPGLVTSPDMARLWPDLASSIGPPPEPAFTGEPRSLTKWEALKLVIQNKLKS